MMKKQFYRLIAGRGSKTEVLNEDLLQEHNSSLNQAVKLSFIATVVASSFVSQRKIEKHIEHVRTATQVTSKKLCQCMQTHGIGDVEKRQKRLAETSLSQSMHDSSKQLLTEGDANHLFGSYLKICAEVQAGIAGEKAQYEQFLDEEVLAPLQNLVDVEIPSVLRHRERLKKLVSDRDIAEQNYHKAKANKGSLTQSSINAPVSAAKLEALKDESDQAILRMEHCRDQFVIDMFDYLGREIGHSQVLSNFHSKQLEYHQNCVKLLEKLQPHFHTEDTAMNRSFGLPLTDHLRATGRKIALPLEACVLCLQHFGLKEEGLFRVGGGASKLRKMRAVLDGGKLDLHAYDAQDDIHAVAGALKQYFRELPDPLLTLDLYDHWKAAADIQDHDQKLQEIWAVIHDMPPENKANFEYLMKFCALVENNHDVNKMSAGNIALVLAPNLLWANTDEVSKSMMASGMAANIVEQVITYVDYFFPDEIDFVVTPYATNYHTLPSRDSEPAMTPESPTAAPVVVPMSPSAKPRAKSHSRNSSNEMNLSDNNSNNSSHKPRKLKHKAPPPPKQQLTSFANSQQESKSPAVVRRGISQENKHPVAAKRNSTKKPQMPPPNPPSVEQNGEEPAAKPRPQMRRGGNGNYPPIPANKPTLPPVNNPPSSAMPQKEESTSSPESPPTPEPRKTGSASTFKMEDDEITETVHVTPL